MNLRRAAWAAEALRTFVDVVHTDKEDAIPDLICDLMHLARKSNQDPHALVERAIRNFEAEEMEEAS